MLYKEMLYKEWVSLLNDRLLKSQVTGVDISDITRFIHDFNIHHYIQYAYDSEEDVLDDMEHGFKIVYPKYFREEKLNSLLNNNE